MSRILAKLRSRRWTYNDYTEVDLFDMDRNPLDFSGGKLNTKNYGPSTPFGAINHLDWLAAGGKVAVDTFELDRISLGAAFCAAVFDVTAGAAGDGRSLNVQLQVEPQGGGGGAMAVLANGTFMTNAAGYKTSQNAGISQDFVWSILYPGIYDVTVYCQAIHGDGGPATDVDITVRQIAATLIWIPSEAGPTGPGWGGSGT